MRAKRLVLPLLSMLAACGDIVEPEPARPLFERYMAVGNSITAGFESDGINDSTQLNSYAVLLARRANASFPIPHLAPPGCPAPLVGPIVLTSERVGGPQFFPCAGLRTPMSADVGSIAFPGLRIADALAPPSGLPGLVYAQAYGQRSAMQILQEGRPTVVTLWLGNNDVLGAALSGDPAAMTPLADFQQSLDRIVTGLRAIGGLQQVVLIGVIDPQLAPAIQPGAFLWAASREPALALSRPLRVDDDCAPFLPDGTANPRAANLVSLRAANDAAGRAVSCGDDAPFVLSAGERQAVTGRVAEFNQSLRRAAETNDWLFLDANRMLLDLTMDPDRIRRCQGLAGASDSAAFLAAVAATCPSPSAPGFFGSLISFDGVHPSRAGQEVIAEGLARLLALE